MHYYHIITAVIAFACASHARPSYGKCGKRYVVGARIMGANIQGGSASLNAPSATWKKAGDKITVGVQLPSGSSRYFVQIDQGKVSTSSGSCKCDDHYCYSDSASGSLTFTWTAPTGVYEDVELRFTYGSNYGQTRQNTIKLIFNGEIPTTRTTKTLTVTSVTETITKTSVTTTKTTTVTKTSKTITATTKTTTLTETTTKTATTATSRTATQTSGTVTKTTVTKTTFTTVKGETSITSTSATTTKSTVTITTATKTSTTGTSNTQTSSLTRSSVTQTETTSKTSTSATKSATFTQTKTSATKSTQTETTFLWKAETLASYTKVGNASACYIVIYGGERCKSDGGVYLVSSGWYTGHFGGQAAIERSCGKVIENWFGKSGGHKGYSDNLRDGTDLGGRAKFIAKLDCGAPTEEVNSTTTTTHSSTSVKIKSTAVITTSVDGDTGNVKSSGNDSSSKTDKHVSNTLIIVVIFTLLLSVLIFFILKRKMKSNAVAKGQEQGYETSQMPVYSTNYVNPALNTNLGDIFTRPEESNEVDEGYLITGSPTNEEATPKGTDTMTSKDFGFDTEHGGNNGLRGSGHANPVYGEEQYASVEEAPYEAPYDNTTPENIRHYDTMKSDDYGFSPSNQNTDTMKSTDYGFSSSGNDAASTDEIEVVPREVIEEPRDAIIEDKVPSPDDSSKSATMKSIDFGFDEANSFIEL
eukprot:m.308078 g.308078  ORF g.308078 m.308078 type:complete len:700 (-) comp16470_c0_seq8:91-2190(-)